jgi:hypothetical protein
MLQDIGCGAMARLRGRGGRDAPAAPQTPAFFSEKGRLSPKEAIAPKKTKTQKKTKNHDRSETLSPKSPPHNGPSAG